MNALHVLKIADIIDETPDVLIMLDVNFRIVEVSNHFIIHSKLSKDIVVNSQLTDLIHPDENSFIAQKIWYKIPELRHLIQFPENINPSNIKDISDNVNIKITDIEGNLVAEAESRTNLRYKGYNLEIDGGTAYWNGKNLGNNQVASGVYLIMLSDLDTFETKVLKLMIVR